MGSLQKKLENLHQTAEDNNTYEALQIIKDVESVCSNRLPFHQLQRNIALMLNGEASFLTFINKINSDKLFLKCKEAALDVLLNFVNKISNLVLPYAAFLRQTCFHVAQIERGSNAKEKSYKIISKLIKLCVGEHADKLEASRVYELVYRELGNSKRAGARVRGRCFAILGKLAQFHRDCFVTKADRIYDTLLNELKKHMTTSAHMEMPVIEGCLKGVQRIMHAFPRSTVDHAEIANKIFDFVLLSLNPVEDLKTFGVPKASLKLLSLHMAQFGALVRTRHTDLYKALCKWFAHNNTQLQHNSYVALSAFFKQVSTTLTEENDSNENNKNLFIFFISEFERMMSSTNSNGKQLSLAVRGYGWFALPCRRYMPSNDFKCMLVGMTTRCERIYLNEEPSYDQIYQLPSFLESLATIAMALNEPLDDDTITIPEPFLLTLKKLTIIMMKEYTRLNRKFAVPIQRSIMAVLIAFSVKPDVLKTLIADIVYQGLIHTFSQELYISDELSYNVGVESTNIDARMDARAISYKDYLPLWYGMLAMHENKLFNAPTLVTNAHVQESIFHEIINSIVAISGKLNLAVKKITHEDSSFDLKAENLSDYKIFINLTSFCEEFLAEISTSRSYEDTTHFALSSKMHEIFKHFVKMSTRNQSVSGFYKICASLLRACVAIDYFDTDEPMEIQPQDGAMYPPENRKCATLVVRFAREVINRQRAWRNELLASSLFFLFTIPSALVRDLLHHMVAPLKLAFELGHTHMSLADAALVAMETWQGAFSLEVVNEHFAQVWSSLEPYLHLTNENQCDPTAHSEKPKRRKTKTKSEATISAESERNKLREKVLSYLGSLGGHVHSCVPRDKVEKSEVMLSWASDIQIPFKFPFQSMNADINIENLFSRVTYLALNSSDRPTKVAACELLHALTVYTVGWNAQQAPETQRKKPVRKLYKRLFPAVIRLACDLEMVTKQLFEPLLMQLIHWLTNNRKYESEDTMVLLEAILGGLVEEGNSSVQEICARSVNEYLLWSVKQNKGDSARKNAKSLFKRLFNLAKHPSIAKRFGSALAVNRLYIVFREQNDLVDEFLIEMIIVFIDSVSMAHYDVGNAGTVAQCKEVLTHLERIIKQKAKQFNEPSKHRRRPVAFGKDAPVTLDTLVAWLFEQFGRPQTEACHQCISLFYTLLPLTTSAVSPKQWLQNKIQTRGREYIIHCFEGRYSGNEGIHRYVHPHMLRSIGLVQSANAWFDMLLSALDGYLFVMEQSWIEVQLLKDKSSNLLKCVDFFLERIATKNLHEYAEEYKSGDNIDAFTTFELDDFSRRKCSVIVRIVQLACTVTKQTNGKIDKVFSQSVLNGIITIVSRIIFSREKLDFIHEIDVEISEKLPELMEQIVTILNKHLSEELKEKLYDEFSNQISQEKYLLTTIQSIPNSSNQQHVDYDKIIETIEAYHLMQRVGILASIMEHSNINDNPSNLATSLFDLMQSFVVTSDKELSHTKQISLKVVALTRNLLQFIFSAGIPHVKVISSIMDTTPLCDETGQCLSSNKGLLFFTVWRETFAEEFCKNCTVYIACIASFANTNTQTCQTVLNSILDCLIKNRQLRKKLAKSVCNEILSRMSDDLRGWWRSGIVEEQLIIVSLMRKLLMIDDSVCRDESHASSATFFEVYKSILLNKKLSLDYKSKALDVVSFFTLNESRSSDLETTLQQFSNENFPLKSSEFVAGSPEAIGYKIAVKKLLSALKLTGSTMLLKILLPIFCREESHLLLHDFTTSLNECTKSNTESNQARLLACGMKWFSADVPSTVQYRAVNTVVLNLITQCTHNTLVQFYTEHIVKIMDVLHEEPRKFSDEIWQSQLQRKISAYRLMEVMFTTLSQDDVEIHSAPVVAAYHKHKSTLLLKGFMSIANRDKNEDMTEQPRLAEERRLFHCSCYNALIAAIVCSKTDVKWFEAFLFTHKPDRNQFLFDNLIDKTRTYEFALQLDKPLEKRKKFVAIRKNFKATKQDEDSNFAAVSYIPSLANSSLCEDADQFDFNLTKTIHGSLRDSQADGGEIGHQGHASATTITRDMAGGEVELESDELNQHECMSNVMGAIMHMKENNIGFTSNKSQAPPSWLFSLKRKLEDEEAHLNVKLFIVKLIVNLEDIFLPYASVFIHPLMKIVVAMMKTNSITNFVIDVLTTLLLWSSAAIAKDDFEGRSLTRGVVEQLMRNVSHPVRPIMRHNLDLLKTVLECWKPRVSEVNTDIVHEQLSSTDPSSSDNFCGLQILGILLSNGLPPYTPSATIAREEYFKSVIVNLTYSRKDVIDTSAEVVGMMLKYLAEKESETRGEVQDMVHEALKSLIDSRRSGVWKVGAFSSCLRMIAHHYPPAAENHFITRIFFELPKIPGGDIRLNCMQIILERASEIDDLLINLKNIKFLSMLQHRDEFLQLTCLKLCNALFQSCKTNEACLETANYFLPVVKETFIDHGNVLCRQEMYELAMMILDSQSIIETSYSNQIESTCRMILVSGLSDQDEMLRTQILNYWTDENVSRLPNNISYKVTDVLASLFHSEFDGNSFLSSTCNILLQATSRSADFESKLFANPLSECVFQEQPVDYRWHTNQSTMAPMFAETIQNTLSTFSGSGMFHKPHHVPPNVVQATPANVEFSATVDGNSTFNWMTGGSVSTFASLGGGDMAPSTGGSFLLPSKPRQAGRKFGRVPVGKDFGKKMLGAGDATGDDDNSQFKLDIQRLRRRFIKTNHREESNRFAHYSEQKKRQKEILQKRDMTERAHGVRLYRTYRYGDLPDIEIPYKGVIIPLGALSQMDATFTSMLASAVISGVVKQTIQWGEKDYETKISSALERLLSSTTTQHSTLVSCMFNIILDHVGKVVLPPEVVAMAAINTNQPALGIRVIEEMIIFESNKVNPPVVKRKKTHPRESSKVTQMWMELARLYKFKNDHETLHGIFSWGPVQRSEFSRALEREMESKYRSASAEYQKLIGQEWEEEPSALERELWDESLMNCLRNMGKWDRIVEYLEAPLKTESQDLDLNQLWDDGSKLIYMEPLIHSKLMLFLQSEGVGSNHAENIQKFFDANMTHSDLRRSVIEERFSADIALLFCHNDNFDQAPHFLKQSLKNFSSVWSTMDRSSYDNITMMLHKLTHITDLADYISSMKELTNMTSVEPSHVSRLMARWTGHLPHMLYDPATTWEQTVIKRCYYLDRILHKLEHNSSQELFDEFTHSVLCAKLELYTIAIQVTCQQRNFDLARKLVRDMSVFENLDENSSEFVIMNHNVARYKLSQMRHGDVPRAKHCATLETVKDTLESLDVERNGVALRSTHNLLMASLLDLSMNLAKSSHDAEMTQNIESMFCDDTIEQQTFDCFVNNYNMVMNEEAPNEQYEAAVALGKFCDESLKTQISEMSTSTSSPVPTDAQLKYAKHCITSTMYALRHKPRSCSEDVSLRLPRLLQIVELFPQIIEFFKNEVSTLQSWQFLRWTNQIVSILDQSHASAVHGIVSRMSDDFPQALVYPMQTSAAGFKFQRDHTGKSNSNFVKKIQSSLEASVPLAKPFVRNLCLLTSPFHIFKNWTETTRDLLEKNPVDKTQQILNKYQSMYVDLFGSDEAEQSSLEDEDGYSPVVVSGVYRNGFTKKFKSEVDAAFDGANGQKLPTMSAKQFTMKSQALITNMKKYDDRTAGPGTLKEYSNWLANFNLIFRGENELEVPGQYSGRGKPLVEYHARICGFSDRVLVMKSLQKPKRIEIVASDAKSYLFLVKGNEDLRQDQRIEQTFEVINDILKKDRKCWVKNLSLNTYQVIPISSKVGLIEWVENSLLYKEVIEAEAIRNNCKEGFDRAQQAYYKYVCNHGSNLKRCHVKIAQFTRSEICGFHDKTIALTKTDVLRKVYLKMSANPESFLTLRTQFCASYGTLCVAHWLLGIGDRHESNMMISTDNGSVIGIDFGHAFGTATELLPVPELMPFRLTPQIKTLLAPHKITHGVFRQSMIDCMVALRQFQDTLLCVLDVFVKEPSVDWLKNAQHIQRRMRQSTEDSAVSLKSTITSVDIAESSLHNELWYPIRKINVVKKKLNGCNPKEITKDEIDHNCNIPDSSKPDYKSIADGHTGYNIRSRQSEDGLSVAEQIDCLIDQSNDPNILGRSYMGWKFWM